MVTKYTNVLDNHYPISQMYQWIFQGEKMNRADRLSQAGITVHFPEGYVPLSTLISVIDLNVTTAWQPASSGRI